MEIGELPWFYSFPYTLVVTSKLKESSSISKSWNPYSPFSIYGFKSFINYLAQSDNQSFQNPKFDLYYVNRQNSLLISFSKGVNIKVALIMASHSGSLMILGRSSQEESSFQVPYQKKCRKSCLGRVLSMAINLKPQTTQQKRTYLTTFPSVLYSHSYLTCKCAENQYSGVNFSTKGIKAGLPRVFVSISFLKQGFFFSNLLFCSFVCCEQIPSGQSCVRNMSIFFVQRRSLKTSNARVWQTVFIWSFSKGISSQLPLWKSQYLNIPDIPANLNFTSPFYTVTTPQDPRQQIFGAIHPPYMSSRKQFDPSWLPPTKMVRQWFFFFPEQYFQKSPIYLYLSGQLIHPMSY